MDIRNLITALETIYPKYKEPNLENKYVKHSDILPLIQRLDENKQFDVQKIGLSVEEKAIYKIALGRGTKNILIWSQMHGNESTGTRAIFDVLNYLNNNLDKDFVISWLSDYRLHFIPMLNPDGAEIYSRRNSLDIDINRDAKAQQTPEAKLLIEWREILQSDWAFNLHDQIPHYSAGRSDNPACISLLAPAFNPAKEVDKNRSKTMQLIALLSKVIIPFIPDMVARYWSDYSARSFGDYFQGHGTKTVLIESGRYPFEKNKETPRKMNFLMLLASLEILTSKIYLNESIDSYLLIPENKRNFYDLIIHNVRWKHKGVELRVDIAVNQYEEVLIEGSNFKLRSEIADIGDLSTEFSLLHFQANEMEIHPALIFPESYDDSSVIYPNFVLSNFRKGYLLFPLNNYLEGHKYEDIEFHVVPAEYKAPQVIRIGQSADFYLEHNNKIQLVVVNGELKELN